MIKPVLIDSCIWIDFFNKNKHRELLEWISNNFSLSTNYCILSEVVPGLIHSKKKEAANLLLTQRKLELKIEWPEIIELQVHFLKYGLNKIGVVDLIIIQNAIQNNSAIASIDKHMKKMCNKMKIKVIEGE